MENRPRILFFGFSDVGYRCLKMLLDKGYSPREQTKENAAAWDDGAQYWLNLRDNAQSAAS